MNKVLLFLFFLLVSTAVRGGEVAGTHLADSVETDDAVTLQLNGAGVRSKFFMKIYIAGLYLENHSTSASEVLADHAHKRMLMHILYAKVGREKLVAGWKDGFAANLSTTEVKELSPQIQRFNELSVDVQRGDEIIFDYRPGHGTSVSIAGDLKGTIEGMAFNQALFSIWLGEKPVTTELRQELLGGVR